MKRCIEIVSLLFLLISLLSCRKSPEGTGTTPDTVKPVSIMVMSFNVRFGTAQETKPENNWVNRRDACCDMINSVRPMMMGVQELDKDQRDYIIGKCPDYDVFGRPCDNSEAEGEQTAIFYLRDSISVIERGMIWLTDTPGVMSRLPSTHHYRTATWVKARHIRSGKVFFHINTHLDNKSSEVREAEMPVLLNFIAARCGNLPVVLTADWNADDDDKIFDELFTSFKDARYTAPQGDRGPTFNSFSSSNLRLDHIFYRGFDSCDKFAVERRSWQGHTYISDHYPIYAILNL